MTVDPNAILATGMSVNQALEMLAEVERRAKRPWRDELFDKQKAVCLDQSPVVAIHPGRRAGKTHTAMAKIFDAMRDHPGQQCAYLALTRGSAKRIMWEEMKRANQRLKLGLEFGEVELTVRDPSNGSSCLLGGADDAAAIERLRGGKYSLVVVDECGSFMPGILHSLIKEVVRPALGDLRGQLLLAGTPAKVCLGIFFDACTDPKLGWSVHHWTVLDNPHFPDPHGYLAQERTLNRYLESHPIYRREWLGEWVVSTDTLVYQYDDRRNGVDDTPDGHALRCVVGVDYGFKDSTAFAVLGYESKGRRTWVIESFKEAGLTPSDAAKITLRLMRQYDPDCVVGDVGGLGKGYAEEAKKRFGIPIRTAKKTDKRGAIELLNGDLISGLLLVVRSHNAPLINEWAVLPWKDGNRDHEAEGFDNHVSDATLYAYRECRAWAGELDYGNVVPGSIEDNEMREQAIWEEHDAAQARMRDEWMLD